MAQVERKEIPFKHKKMGVFLAVRVVVHWHRLHIEVVEPPFIEILKPQLLRVLDPL